MTIYREVLENGEIIERPYNEAEMAELEAAKAKALAKAQAEEEAAAKKAAAEAKLAVLGLDLNDLRALGLQHNL